MRSLPRFSLIETKCHSTFANAAQPPDVCREKERLEHEAEETLYLRHEEAYRRTIGVGRYELSLDTLQEDLDDAREKLVMLVAMYPTAVRTCRSISACGPSEERC